MSTPNRCGDTQNPIHACHNYRLTWPQVYTKGVLDCTCTVSNMKLKLPLHRKPYLQQKWCIPCRLLCRFIYFFIIRTECNPFLSNSINEKDPPSAESEGLQSYCYWSNHIYKIIQIVHESMLCFKYFSPTVGEKQVLGLGFPVGKSSLHMAGIIFQFQFNTLDI